MADVRLTATNPEDSTVVPVACNAKGELKLEEIPDYSFDGNLNGDLSVSGTATFSGTTNLNGEIKAREAIFRKCDDQQDIFLDMASKTGGNYGGNGDYLIYQFRHGYWSSSNPVIKIVATGVSNPSGNGRGYGYLTIWTGNSGNGDAGEELQKRVTFDASGYVYINDGKAGFTPEGYFWCTTRRGDKVILDATSNGMGLWEAYASSGREMLEAWAEKNAIRPKPEESSQD